MQVGDEVMVMVIDISSDGKVRLSRQAVLENWTAEEARERDQANRRGRSGGRSGGAFFDAGNVYRYIDEFNPLDIRTAVGFGLRLNIPALFLRLDYGINLSPREFEPRGVFYISFGQAF